MLGKRIHFIPHVLDVLISEMGGVDGFDAVSFGSSLARKCNRWPVRVIEHVGTFLITNAKTAHCIYVNKNVKNYTNKLFYIDVLKEYYPPVKNLKEIELEFIP